MSTQSLVLESKILESLLNSKQNTIEKNHFNTKMYNFQSGYFYFDKSYVPCFFNKLSFYITYSSYGVCCWRKGCHRLYTSGKESEKQQMNRTRKMEIDHMKNQNFMIFICVSLFCFMNCMIVYCEIQFGNRIYHFLKV